MGTADPKSKNKERLDASERLFIASSWQLMGRKFKKHKLAIAGVVILAILYVMAIFCQFFAPYDIYARRSDYLFTPPQRVHFFDQGRFSPRPFVYGLTVAINEETLRRRYVEDRSVKYPIHFFVHGDTYKLWGLFPTDLHLMGVKDPGVLFLAGTDSLGRDMFSRILFGARISLSIGLVGVAISFVLGCIMGGISGYFGGPADMIIQRIVDFLQSIPDLPLWMGLSAAIPTNWPILRVYFVITVILSTLGWTGLARTVRGKLLQLREEDYVLAAKIAGASPSRIIGKHLIPGFLSYLIVSLTLSIPYMILGETALSFLGIGLRAPAVSWGVLLQDAQNVRTVALNPWLMIPALFVIITVMSFNFVGDGLRDAADPYK